MFFQATTIDEIYKHVRLPSSKWQKVYFQLTPTAITKAQKGLYGKPTTEDNYWETIFREFKNKNTINQQDPLRYQTKKIKKRN